VKAGTYTMTVSAPLYGTVTQSVTVVGGQTTSVTVGLRLLGLL
jgi:PEGA domain